MKTLPLILALLLACAEPALAAPQDWLRSAAGELGYDRCRETLVQMARDGVSGRPLGKNLESARHMPDKQFLGGFILSLAGEQPRHHSLSLGENQKFMCEGRLTTTYVEPGSCDNFVGRYLDGGELLGDMGNGRTRVYDNAPWQLYLTDLEHAEGCLVTGVRRYGTVDPRSDCRYRDLGTGAAAELCLLFRAGQAPVLTLKLDTQPVFMLREDLTDEFSLTHPLQSDRRKTAVIRGRCKPEQRDGRMVARVCDLEWAGETLFDGVRLGPAE